VILQEEKHVSIERDYWKLTLTAAENVVLVQGRRRTTEGFWPGLILSMEGFARFANAMQDVTSIVDDCFTNPQRQMVPMFPHADVLAVCDGPDYMIEMATSMVGTGLSSIGITMYGKQTQLLPFMYLVDEEVWRFSADVDDVALNWIGFAPAAA
jgi:hypothetical protein